MQRWPDKDVSLVSASHISTDSDEISDVSDEEDIQYGENGLFNLTAKSEAAMIVQSENLPLSKVQADVDEGKISEIDSPLHVNEGTPELFGPPPELDVDYLDDSEAEYSHSWVGSPDRTRVSSGSAGLGRSFSEDEIQKQLEGKNGNTLPDQFVEKDCGGAASAVETADQTDKGFSVAQTILATTSDGDFKKNYKHEVFDTNPKPDAASKSVADLSPKPQNDGASAGAAQVEKVPTPKSWFVSGVVTPIDTGAKSQQPPQPLPPIPANSTPKGGFDPTSMPSFMFTDAVQQDLTTGGFFIAGEGDTPEGVARAMHVPLEELLEVNQLQFPGLQPESDLLEGMRLQLPSLRSRCNSSRRPAQSKGKSAAPARAKAAPTKTRTKNVVRKKAAKIVSGHLGKANKSTSKVRKRTTGRSVTSSVGIIFNNPTNKRNMEYHTAVLRRREQARIEHENSKHQKTIQERNKKGTRNYKKSGRLHRRAQHRRAAGSSALGKTIQPEMQF